MPARFRTHATVIVHRSVPLAFVGADLTSQHARVKLRVDHFVWCLGLSHEQSGRDQANISTIEIRSDTPPQFRQVVRFVQAGVRTGRADLRTQRQGIEGLRIMLRMLEVWMRVAPKHCLDEIHWPTYSGFIDPPSGNRLRPG